MSKKDKRRMREFVDAQAWQQVATSTFTFARTQCSECSSQALYQGTDKNVYSLAQALGFDEASNKIMDFMETFGLCEMWLCRDCGAFGAFL